jgi:probable phosphoglycerate mutase
MVRDAGEDTRLVSSPLRRARETAAPLAGLLQLQVSENAAFREIPSPVAQAQRQAWLRQFMQQEWDEQSDDLVAWRATAWGQLLALEHSTVIFTHFLLINAVVGQILGRTQTLCFWPANGSITRLRHTGSDLELIALGEETQSLVN